MGGLFGGGKSTPAVEPAPPPIKQDDPLAAEKALAERKRFRNAKGNASNILTSGVGVTGEPDTARAVLLG